jgi:hypothetical protein
MRSTCTYFGSPHFHARPRPKPRPAEILAASLLNNIRERLYRESRAVLYGLRERRLLHFHPEKPLAPTRNCSSPSPRLRSVLDAGSQHVVASLDPGSPKFDGGIASNRSAGTISVRFRARPERRRSPLRLPRKQIRERPNRFRIRIREKPPEHGEQFAGRRESWPCAIPRKGLTGRPAIPSLVTVPNK